MCENTFLKLSFHGDVVVERENRLTLSKGERKIDGKSVWKTPKNYVFYIKGDRVHDFPIYLSAIGSVPYIFLSDTFPPNVIEF